MNKQTLIKRKVELETMLKLLVVGDIGVGKTSCVQRLTKNVFSDKYKATIGVDFATKDIHRQGKDYKINFWDIAGQERNSVMTRSYFNGAHGAILIFDVTSQSSRESISKWKTELDSKVSFPGTETVHIPVILFANKVDLEKISEEEMKQLQIDYDFCGVVATSAKDSIGLYDGLLHLMETIDHISIQNPKKIETSKVVKLEQSEAKKEGCC